MIRLKTLLVFGCLLLCFATILFMLTANTKLRIQPSKNNIKVQQHIKPDTVKYEVEDSSSSPSLYYCNFPFKNDMITAEEGKPLKPDWKLTQVQIVIRHGDRSPIGSQLYKKLNVRPDYCQLRPDRDPSHPSLKKFMQTISSDHIRMLMQGRKFIHSPFPKYDVCGSASLSQLGVVQHILNGEILQKAFLQNNQLLVESISNRANLRKKVNVLSTIRSRTVQSAIAFLYGLIPDFHLDEVDIKYTNSDTFSMKHCPASHLTDKHIKNIRYETYIDRQMNNSTFRKLADGFNINDHSGVLIDNFVTGFLCKNFKLPCLQNQSCVTVDDLDVLLNEEEFMSKKVCEKSKFFQQSVLRLHPLLSRILNLMMTKTKQINDSAPDVVLISGHDTTLKPLIRALGIPDYRWPRLGTRLVFELWVDPSDDQYFVRILLNGKDYTLQTDFCKDDRKYSGFCTVEQFHSHITSGIFKNFGVKTYEEACKTAH